MGKKSTPQAPTPVDPVALANAQGAANTATAQEQQKLNMVNSTGPDGSVNWSASDAPGGYTQTTTLSPAQQGIYNSSVAGQQGALDLANAQLPRLQQALSSTIAAPSFQTSFEGGGPLATSVANAGQIQTGVPTGQALQQSYDAGGQIQRSMGPTDFTQDRRDVTDAVWGQAVSRLAPEYGKMANRLDTKLANQGIGANSAAFGNSQDAFGRQVNDAYNQAAYSAVQAGANEQNTLFGQSLAQGNFANSAQAQANSQNAAQADFYNTAQRNEFERALAAGNFANAAQGQQYGQNFDAAQLQNQAQNQQFNQNNAMAQFGNQALGQQFEADNYAQNQPINQFNSLMSSGQVSMPQGFSYTPTQVAGTDVIGANALSANQQQAAFNTQSQAQSAANGGLFSLGAAALAAPMTGGTSLAGKFFTSDRRLKADIERLGTRPDGLGVYAYRYLWSPLRYIGVMAQEVLWVKPGAVARMPDGYLAVDYGAL